MAELPGHLAPAQIGDNVHAVETPALLLDLDAFSQNTRRMSETLSWFPTVTVRPHAKAHKCPEIAKLQLSALGNAGVGVCVQKVTEAEAMVHGGVLDVLVSNEVASRKKLERLAALVKIGATIALCVDNEQQVKDAADVAEAQQVKFGILVDVNVGQNRCGVETKEEALALAKQVKSCSHLWFRGVQAYHGAAQHIRSHAERCGAVDSFSVKTKSVVDHIRHHGIEVQTVAGGGTGTYQAECASEIYNEIEPGSYIFNDADYARNLDERHEPVKDWKQSLFVLTTVYSRNVTGGWVVVDAGLKALSVDSGVPLVADYEGATYTPAGDEHGIVTFAEGAELPPLGTKIKLIPGHCDPTVNMHDYFVGYRGEAVESVWRITGRGPGL
eukprot:GILK01000735.1.p1 GENE.GILK01000735.1~~GILK01000735.1.p1  ORF type:complete len:400 (+),score=51.66 GILK01000735.1:47-1201(+)